MNAGSTDFTANKTQSSLTIEFNHDYKFCKTFDVEVYLDGMLKSNCENLKPEARRCVIEDLQPNTTYRVTVIAKELGMANSTMTESITTLGTV